MEDIVHDCSYFENDAEFYCEPVKLFEGSSLSMYITQI